LVTLAGVGAGAAYVARTHVELAVVALIHALALVPLFATGRVAQLPPDLARDAWPTLRRAAAAIGEIPKVRVKPIARLTMARDGASGSAGVDEVRARIDVGDEAVAQGLQHLELGCAIVQGTGAATLVPELLIRARAGSPAHDRLLEAVAEGGEATFDVAMGRTPEDVVVAIRPAITTPAALRSWVSWTLALVGAPAKEARKPDVPTLMAAATM
jgi:hypothetical protein